MKGEIHVEGQRERNSEIKVQSQLAITRQELLHHLGPKHFLIYSGDLFSN